jgi:UDP-N-acetylglucosamine--N-acetylmuramyl-(pentapeptide) pyrophosphoryl-undecaprenol N-acetylglucosamine transferase
VCSSDLCRAGAATLAEVTARGIPAVLIPYPFATGNHQYHNASFFAEKKAAILVPEKDLTPMFLLTQIKKLCYDSALRTAMGKQARCLGRPDAGEIIARAILEARYK